MTLFPTFTFSCFCYFCLTDEALPEFPSPSLAAHAVSQATSSIFSKDSFLLNPLWTFESPASLWRSPRSHLVSAPANSSSHSASSGSSSSGSSSSSLSPAIPLPSPLVTITAFSWSPHYSDLFAVSFGTYSFLAEGTGLLCCYSVKNPTFPQSSLNLPAGSFGFFCSFVTLFLDLFSNHRSWRSFSSGIQCVDFHPTDPSLIALGLYDGSIAVADFQPLATQSLLFHSVDPQGILNLSFCDLFFRGVSHSHGILFSFSFFAVKHSACVWGVRWLADVSERGESSFISVGADGKVKRWMMAKNTLVHEVCVVFQGCSMIPLDLGCCFSEYPHTPSCCLPSSI